MFDQLLNSNILHFPQTAYLCFVWRSKYIIFVSLYNITVGVCNGDSVCLLWVITVSMFDQLLNSNTLHFPQTTYATTGWCLYRKECDHCEMESECLNRITVNFSVQQVNVRSCLSTFPVLCEDMYFCNSNAAGLPSQCQWKATAVRQCSLRLHMTEVEHNISVVVNPVFSLFNKVSWQG
jgi:hypothetical protein